MEIGVTDMLSWQRHWKEPLSLINTSHQWLPVQASDGIVSSNMCNLQATLIGGVVGVFWNTPLSEKFWKYPLLKILGKIFEKQGKNSEI